MISRLWNIIICHNDCTWGQKEDHWAHTLRNIHIHRMIEVTAVLLPINGDTESRRGRNKTYVLISMKGWTLTEILPSLVRYITVNRRSKEGFTAATYQHERHLYIKAQITEPPSVIAPKYLMHFFKQCLSSNRTKTFQIRCAISTNTVTSVYFTKTLKLTTSAWGKLLSN